MAQALNHIYRERWLKTLKDYDRLMSELKGYQGRRFCEYVRGDMTMREFAKECGVSASYICFVESGREPMSPRFLKILLEKSDQGELL